MKKSIAILSSLAVAAMTLVSCTHQETINEMIERGLATSKEQSLIMAKNLENQNDKLPKTFENGQIVTSDYSWWCSGFFPGTLWQLYGNFNDEELLNYAKMYTERVDSVRQMNNTHDLGFMINCSFGEGYKYTQDPEYKEALKDGSNNLMTRFNDAIGVFRSWDGGPWQYCVIIDNMMNLEMLCEETKLTADSSYVKAAMRHADTTIKNHFREDYSTYHVVSYDTVTYQPEIKQTAQGYADDSSWSRGQSWGLYGYTMMYRETGEERYLQQAHNIADFLVHHPNMPEDGIPYWDYNAPDIPNALRDASAGAVMASALIELCQYDTKYGEEWLRMAEKQLTTLSSEEYLAKPGELGGFIVKHCVGSLPGNSEVDVPLTYADYYYIEALLRLKKLLAK